MIHVQVQEDGRWYTARDGIFHEGRDEEAEARLATLEKNNPSKRYQIRTL